MADSVIKQAALDRLAARLEAHFAARAGAAALRGKVVSRAADEGDGAEFPSLRIVPGRFTFDHHQEEVVEQATRDLQLVRVGEFTGRVRLRLGTKTAIERRRLEQQVLAAFFQEEGRPGAIVDVVAGIVLDGQAVLHQAPVAFDLEGEDWEDEKVFDHRLYSELDVEVTFPALVLRTGYLIEHLVIALQTDLDGTRVVEEPEIEVLPDGTITDH